MVDLRLGLRRGWTAGSSLHWAKWVGKRFRNIANVPPNSVGRMGNRALSTVYHKTAGKTSMNCEKLAGKVCRWSGQRPVAENAVFPQNCARRERVCGFTPVRVGFPGNSAWILRGKYSGRASGGLWERVHAVEGGMRSFCAVSVRGERVSMCVELVLRQQCFCASSERDERVSMFVDFVRKKAFCTLAPRGSSAVLLRSARGPASELPHGRDQRLAQQDQQRRRQQEREPCAAHRAGVSAGEPRVGDVIERQDGGG